MWKPLLVFAVLLSLTTTGLNIYNLVICGRALTTLKCGGKGGGGGRGPSVVVSIFETAIHKGGGHARKYLIGSMVCSGASIATGGMFPPIPHLVFGILGQSTWHLQSISPCGAASSTPSSSSSSFSYNIHQSLIVIWFTLAASIALICIYRDCSLGCDDCCSVEVDTGKGFSMEV